MGIRSLWPRKGCLTFYRSIKIEVLKLLKFESGEVVGPFETKFGLEFDDQSLTWAVDRLDRMASDVNIILQDDIVSGKVRTKPFSIHLNGANLKEILDAYCVNAAVSTTLAWRQENKNVFIEAVR